MPASMMRRIDDAQFALVMMSTRNLINDRRPLTPPVKPATATIAEILRFKALRSAEVN